MTNQQVGRKNPLALVFRGKQMQCECCEKELKDTFGKTKFCVNCSLHQKKSQQTIGKLNHKIKELEIKLREYAKVSKAREVPTKVEVSKLSAVL